MLFAGAAPLQEDPRFEDAVKKLRALDYEAAERAFDALAAEPRPDPERARLLVWDGAARALLGDEGAARLCFESALRLDDGVQLEPETSPKIVAMFEAARDASRARTAPSASDLLGDAAGDAAASDAGDGADRRDIGAPRAAAGAADRRLAGEEGARGAGDDGRARPGAGAPSTIGAANDDGPPILPVVAAVASSAAALGLAAGAAYVLYDVDGKVRTASDPTTSQAAAAALVDEANAGLWVSSTLGVAAAVFVGGAIAGAVFAVQ